MRYVRDSSPWFPPPLFALLNLLPFWICLPDLGPVVCQPKDIKFFRGLPHAASWIRNLPLAALPPPLALWKHLVAQSRSPPWQESGCWEQMSARLAPVQRSLMNTESDPRRDQALGNDVKKMFAFQNKQPPTLSSAMAFSCLLGISGWLPHLQHKGHRSVMIMANNNNGAAEQEAPRGLLTFWS